MALDCIGWEMITRRIKGGEMQVLESRSDSDDVISLISFQLQSDLKQYPLTITTHVTLMQLSLVYPPSA